MALTRKQQYEICQERKHQKSGILQSGPSGPAWEICTFCGTCYRYVTKVEEKEIPSGS